jgi:hypothetical protein
MTHVLEELWTMPLCCWKHGCVQQQTHSTLSQTHGDLTCFDQMGWGGVGVCVGGGFWLDPALATKSSKLCDEATPSTCLSGAENESIPLSDSDLLSFTVTNYRSRTIFTNWLLASHHAFCRYQRCRNTCTHLPPTVFTSPHAFRHNHSPSQTTAVGPTAPTFHQLVARLTPCILSQPTLQDRLQALVTNSAVKQAVAASVKASLDVELAAIWSRIYTITGLVAVGAAVGVVLTFPGALRRL